MIQTNCRADAESIDQRLPQTQCAKCDYPGCLAYARAIAGGEADINQCPPGGEVTLEALARLLGRPAEPLNLEHGRPQALRLAFIREADCIGCKLCIQACPVDCVIGAAKLMHTVIADDCTGCELCLPVCPTDCIDMVAPPVEGRSPGHIGAPSMWREFSQPQVEKARRRAQQKRLRLSKQSAEREQRRRQRLRQSLKQEILAAVERQRQARQARPPVGQP